MVAGCLQPQLGCERVAGVQPCCACRLRHGHHNGSAANPLVGCTRCPRNAPDYPWNPLDSTSFPCKTASKRSSIARMSVRRCMNRLLWWMVVVKKEPSSPHSPEKSRGILILDEQPILLPLPTRWCSQRCHDRHRRVVGQNRHPCRHRLG